MKLRCIVIDDEPPALALTGNFIAQTPFLELLKVFENPIEALLYIKENEVDLIFLDIQMPDVDGVEFAKILLNSEIKHRPFVVFTTAFDQFAIQGYKLDVVDYLLKPFDYIDFLTAAKKVQKRFELHFDKEADKEEVNDFIFLKVGHDSVKVAFKEIKSVVGLKDYAKFHLVDPERTLLSLITLKALEEKLPCERFMRIHKSTIIALDKITAISKSNVLLGDTRYSVSHQYKSGLIKLLEGWR